jgi:hypothetical protein
MSRGFSPASQHPYSSGGMNFPLAEPAVKQHSRPESNITTHLLMDDILTLAGQRWLRYDLYKYRWHEL